MAGIIFFYNTLVLVYVFYSRGPQPLDHGLVPICSLLGTGLHSRMWVAGERAKLHLPLSIVPHHSYYHLSHPLPGPCKNCFLWNQSLVPKSLGTTCLYHLFQVVCTQVVLIVNYFEYEPWVVANNDSFKESPTKDFTTVQYWKKTPNQKSDYTCYYLLYCQFLMIWRKQCFCFCEARVTYNRDRSRWWSKGRWSSPSQANTSKIHLHAEQFSLKTSWKLVERQLRL